MLKLKEVNEDAHFIYDRSFNKGIKYWIKRIMLFLLGIVYRLLLFVYRRPLEVKKYNVVICAIFKNEALFFREWLEYHKLIGIKHFYLYNNFSNDNYLEILQPYIEREEVTLIDWPVPQGQFSAYEHWFLNFKQNCSWVTFLDLDEFICPLNDQDISLWIKKYEFFPCVAVYWKMFGTSGKIKHDYDKLVVEQYNVCWDKTYSVGKMFYNTNFEIAKFDTSVHHLPQTKLNLLGFVVLIPPINEFYFFVKWNIHRIQNSKYKNARIQINHYWSKSFDFYEAKQKRGDVAYKKSPLNLDYFFWHETNNRAVDYSIFRFVIKLKLALGITKYE